MGPRQSKKGLAEALLWAIVICCDYEWLYTEWSINLIIPSKRYLLLVMPLKCDSIINTIINWVILLNKNIYVKFKLQEGMQEAKSNIEFLQILKEPCDELDETTSPRDIPKIIPTLLQSVRIIWANSLYFNTR
jgi:hypothetical protein